MKKAYLLMLTFACFGFAQEPRGGLILPHVTPTDGNFATQIFLINTSTKPITAHLYPYDSNGTRQTPVDVYLAALAVRSFVPAELFSEASISHFRQQDKGVIRAAVRYEGRNQTGLAAHVLPNLEPSFSFQIDATFAKRCKIFKSIPAKRPFWKRSYRSLKPMRAPAPWVAFVSTRKPV